MEKITFTREQVAAAYDEIIRRLNLEITEADSFLPDLLTKDDIDNNAYHLVQGLYSVFSSLAANWPEVREWTDKEEDERGIFREDET